MLKYIADGEVPKECPECGAELELNSSSENNKYVYTIQCPNCGHEVLWQVETAEEAEKLNEEFNTNDEEDDE